jgi:hypothetical protein
MTTPITAVPRSGFIAANMAPVPPRTRIPAKNQMPALACHVEPLRIDKAAAPASSATLPPAM